MIDPNGGSTDTPSGPSLAAFVSDGWENDVDESPETDTEQVGDPPAETAGALESPASPTDDAAGAPVLAGDPPADAASATPDPEHLGSLDDFLESAQPLPYVVDGQARTFDGITYLGPDKGAFISPEHLAKVQQRISERDHLFETAKTTREQFTTLEKLTAWQQRDAQGVVTTLTGAPALVAQRVALADAIDTTQALCPLLRGEIDPRSLIGVDAEGRVVWDMEALAQLRERASFAVDKSRWVAQRHFEQSTTPQPAAPPAEAPVETMALASIDQTAQQLQITGLTPEDKAFLAQQFPRYVRPATDAERQSSGSSRVLDLAFGDLMKRTAGANVAKAQAVTDASASAARTAAKLAAAALGTGRKTPARAPARQPVLDERAKNQSDAWDYAEHAALAGMAARGPQ